MRGATISYLEAQSIFGISTHTPHAGRDKYALFLYLFFNEFLLTRPMRARPAYDLDGVLERLFLLTRPMRGATPSTYQRLQRQTISTHTPHAGRDRNGRLTHFRIFQFLLTRPMRGATWKRLRKNLDSNFYSHAPCGARQSGRSYR